MAGLCDVSPWLNLKRTLYHPSNGSPSGDALLDEWLRPAVFHSPPRTPFISSFFARVFRILFPWLTTCVPSFQWTPVSEALTVNLFTLTLWIILDTCCLGNKCHCQPRPVNALTCADRSQTTGQRLWPIAGRSWKTRLSDALVQLHSPRQSCLTDLTPAQQKNRSTFLFNDLHWRCTHTHSHTRH